MRRFRDKRGPAQENPSGSFVSDYSCQGPGTPRKPVSGNTSGESSPTNADYSTHDVPISRETSIKAKNPGFFTPTRSDSHVATSYVPQNSQAQNSQSWQDDTSHCSVCKAKFRKRDLNNRRHHCRVCGFCVCGDCSPNKVVVDGFRGPQRVCNPCIRLASSPREQQLREQAALLAQRLRELQDPDYEPGVDREPATVEEALHMAESALLPIAASRERAVFALRDAGERLMALHPSGAGSFVSNAEVGGGVEEAAEFLERALDPAEARLKEAEAELAREARKRAELEARVLQAEATAKLLVKDQSTWRSLQASVAQEASFAGADPGAGAGDGSKCTTDKCTPAACAVM